jgi:uncharacterized protein (TIGR00255 family)
MTGFGRADGTAVTTGETVGSMSWGWSWELRSVNAKGLDIRCRLPSLVEGWEPEVRGRIQARLARGSVTANWTLKRAEDEETATELVVNKGFLRQLVLLQQELEAEGLIMPTAPNLDQMLQVRGVVETVDRAPDQTIVDKLKVRALADLDAALDALVEARRAEGDRIVAALGVHLDEIFDLLGQAQAGAEAQPAALRERMKQQIAVLTDSGAPVSEERLAQELALLATKADVREETDRLAAHVAQCRSLLADGGAVGRKLDFLCQELNREANTLCSKAVTLDLTNIGVELKTRIERFREQIQNIE